MNDNGNFIAMSCERFINMRDRWMPLVNHNAELMEVTSANQGYSAYLRQMAPERNTKLNLVSLPRNQSTKSKDMRILGTQVRFQAREVWINNELADRTTILNDQVRTLWDPDGHIEAGSSTRLPDGELVMQFIRHPFHKYKDIPDTFAMVDEIDRETGKLICFWRKPSHRYMGDAVRRQSAPQSSVGKGYSTRIYERFGRRLPNARRYP